MFRLKDTIEIYLKEIGKIPVLTKAQEINLARKSKKGDEAARHKLIRSNLRLVVSIAKRYNNLGLSISDLVEEGNIGLMRSVEKYDIKRGCRFSTYSSWWIKQAMLRALSNQVKTVRLPVYIVEKISIINRSANQFYRDHGRWPTLQEISQEVNLTTDVVEELQFLDRREDSLQNPYGESGVNELLDSIADNTESSPIRKLAEKMLQEDITEFMEALSEREAKILALRYGLFGSEAQTLDDIGRKFSLTRERVRQIIETATRKLKEHVKTENIEFNDYGGA